MRCRWPARGLRPRNRAGGFSVVELLVALVILLIGLALAAEIGVRARAILALSVRDALRPPIGATLERLRTDVQEADGFTPPAYASPSGWTDEPLVLQGARGTVAYRLRGGTFERVRVDGSGSETGRIALVRDGAAWRWRTVGAGLVEVSISHLAEPGAPGAAGRKVHRDTLRLGLRGAPGRWGW